MDYQLYDDVIYSNLALDPDTYYFLYVGELKAHCLNHYLQRGMQRERGGKVGHISIIQDVLGEYDHENILVLNPIAQQFSEESDGAPRVAFRLPMRDFAMQASQSVAVQDLIRQLLRRQKEVKVWMFENKPELSLREVSGVELLGPNPALVHQFNDKAWQYDTFYGLVPTVDYKICCGNDELLSVTGRMRDVCCDGIFVTHTYSAGGSHSMITRNQDETATRFQDPYARYLISPFIPHEYDPTVLGIVASSQDVYIAGVADQRIEGGSGFRGSTYPSVLPEDIQAPLRQHTRAVGRKLGELGFRGIFGCDFIVDACGNIFFIEVNPRKQGTTMEFTCTLEQLFPPDAHSFIELEYYALSHKRFPTNTPWPDFGDALTKRNNIHWGTYNYKVDRNVVTHDALPQKMPERELFRRCAKHGKGGSLILEHVGANTVVKPGTFLARAVAVDTSHEGMQHRLEEAIQEIERSFSD